MRFLSSSPITTSACSSHGSTVTGLIHSIAIAPTAVSSNPILSKVFAARSCLTTKLDSPNIHYSRGETSERILFIMFSQSLEHNQSLGFRKNPIRYQDASPSIHFFDFQGAAVYLNKRVAYGVALAFGSCLRFLT